MPIRRNYLNVYDDGKRRLLNSTPVTNFNSPGISKGMLDILSVEMEKLYDSVDYIYRSLDPTRAVGSDLDKIGFLVGVSREGSQVASDYTDTNFYLYIDPRLNWGINSLISLNYSLDERNLLEEAGYITRLNGSVISLKIPAGLIVGNSDNSITYTTVDDIVFENSLESNVGIVATSPGPDFNVESNALISHNIKNNFELRKIANFIKCSNRFPIQNGKYTQNDEEYRYLISTAKAALTTNELSIRRAALSVPGIRDILFEKNKFGSGTVNIVIDGISPLISEGLVRAVKEKVQQAASYGDTIFVNKPSYIGVSINYYIDIIPGTVNIDQIRNITKSSIIQYINDLPIGGEIIWNRLESIVMSVDGVKDFIPNYFKLGEYDIFNKINKKEIVLRYGNQRADFNQKFYTDVGMITCCTV